MMAQASHALRDEVVGDPCDGHEEVARDVVHLMVGETDLQMNVAEGDSLHDVAGLERSRRRGGECVGTPT